MFVVETKEKFTNICISSFTCAYFCRQVQGRGVEFLGVFENNLLFTDVCIISCKFLFLMSKLF